MQQSQRSVQKQEQILVNEKANPNNNSYNYDNQDHQNNHSKNIANTNGNSNTTTNNNNINNKCTQNRGDEGKKFAGDIQNNKDLNYKNNPTNNNSNVILNPNPNNMIINIIQAEKQSVNDKVNENQINLVMSYINSKSEKNNINDEINSEFSKKSKVIEVIN